tara:strand:- start:387 stop:2120 length:1734 start_codon:yes stop_codon:yes gene_type:complete
MLSKKYFNVLFSALEKRQKINMIFFALLILFITFLESFSLGIFYPFLQSITNNEINPTILNIYETIKFKLNIDLNFEFISILILAAIIVTKNLLSFFFEYWQLSFLNQLRINIKTKILKSHFNNEYEISSNIKMSTYVRDFNSTIETFVISFYSLIQFFIELAIFLGVLILLFIIQSKEVIFFSTLIASIALIIFFLLKKLMNRYGQKHLEFQEKSLGKLIDILNSTKEIIVFKKESLFTKQFKSIEFKSLDIIKKVSLLTKFPKFFFESLVIISFTVFIFFAKSKGIELSQLLPELSIVFLALLKLLPGITKLLFYSQKLGFAEKAATKISNDIKIYEKTEKQKQLNLEKISFNQSIELKNIKFKYKSRDNIIFENLNFKMNKGEYIGIHGPSGGGKSTFIGLLCGFLKPISGEIIIDENKILNLSQTNWLEKVSYLTQENNLIDESILRNITFEFDNQKIDFDLFKIVCEQSGLNNLIQKSPEKFNTEIGQKGISISGGERQRIGIARSLYAKKEILIFDESTSNLDDENKFKFIETINQLSLNKTIIIISHDQEVIKNCKIKFLITNNNLSILS